MITEAIIVYTDLEKMIIINGKGMLTFDEYVVIQEDITDEEIQSRWPGVRWIVRVQSKKGRGKNEKYSI